MRRFVSDVFFSDLKWRSRLIEHKDIVPPNDTVEARRTGDARLEPGRSSGVSSSRPFGGGPYSWFLSDGRFQPVE
jgi:hypothetical protein